MNLLAALLCVLVAPALVRATFGFITIPSSPTSCGNFTVGWAGGTPPFVLTLFPVFTPTVTVQIPAEAFSDGQGAYTMQLPLNASTKFAAVMSDATGFAAGGISPIIEVSSAVDGAACDTQLTQGWSWDSTSAAQQCKPYIIHSIDPAMVEYPIKVLILVPGGEYQNFTLPASVDSTYTYDTPFALPPLAAAAGTSVIVSLADNNGRSGGDSDLYTVLQSGNASCLASALTSTAIPAPTDVAPPAASSAGASSPAALAATRTGALSGGTIGAIAAAGVVGLGAAIAFAFYCWRTRRRAQRKRQLDMGGGDEESPVFIAATQHEPFTLGATGSELGSWTSATRSLAATSTVAALSPPLSLRSKASRAMLLDAPSPVVVVHTDAADAPAPAPEVVELPPLYDESRRPKTEYLQGGAAGAPSNAPAEDAERTT